MYTSGNGLTLVYGANAVFNCVKDIVNNVVSVRESRGCNIIADYDNVVRALSGAYELYSALGKMYEITNYLTANALVG